MTKLANEVFTLASATTHKGFGLAALFVAPALGIDEVKESGNNNFAVWSGARDAAFEVLSPAFDPTASYAMPSDGSRVLLSHTLTAHSKGAGLVTISGGTNAASNPVAELISVVGTSKIIVSLNVIA